MIEELKTSRSAYFFRCKRRMTLKAIRALFADVQHNAVAPARPIFRAERKKLGAVRYSAICFAFERPVSFLDGVPKRTERVYGFILLVEKAKLVALFRSGIDLTATFKRTYLDPVERSRVEGAIAQTDAIFEKLSLRNMTTSRQALRAKTLEARDLENAIATSSAGRFIPQGYRVRRADGSYSATPSTGRIAVRSDRVGYEELAGWAGQIIDLLTDESSVASAFIKNFARPIELSQVGPDVPPKYFSPDTIALADLISESDEPIRLVRQDGDVWCALSSAEIETILADLDQPFEIESADNAYLIRTADHGAIGSIGIGKSRISLKRLNIPSIANIFVENADFAVGADQGRISLVRYLDDEGLFTVLFADLAIAYIDGHLFRDDALVGGGAMFLRHLHVEPLLAAATSEKGAVAQGQNEFSAESVFRIVVDSVAGEDVLVCDDLGDEWADFIGVTPGTSPALISFYHAKHGERSLSASAFHDAVGQAIKNLGRLSLTSDAVRAKFGGWADVYRKDNTTTAISRLIRGGSAAEIEAKMANASAAPDVLRRVFIVTSSLSRQDIAECFARAAAGQSVRPSFVQLYWLLMGFFSACVEIGAVGFVVCQP
jgi:hypothetical protein